MICGKEMVSNSLFVRSIILMCNKCFLNLVLILRSVCLWFVLVPNNKWLSLSQLVVDLVDYDSPKLFDQMFLEIVRQDKFDITNGGCAQRYVLPLIPENEVSLFCKSFNLPSVLSRKLRPGQIIFQ